MKEAQAAKSALKATLRSAGVEASCGITKSGEQYAVKVNLPDSSRQASVPASIHGTPVVVEIIGQVRAVARR